MCRERAGSGLVSLDECKLRRDPPKRLLGGENGGDSHASAESVWGPRSERGNGALGGGIMRDIVLGHIPPATLSDWRYLAAAGLAGLLVFLWFSRVVHHGKFLTTFDAIGLSIFTVTGTTIALDAGLGPAPAALLGMLTGVGGGVVRDVMAAEVPLIFRSEVYAVASMLGAIIVI